MRTMGGSAPASCPRPSGGSERGVGSGPVQQYSDVQQLFVGNLPHNCTEDDLRELFCQWGRVADIRISNKGAAQSKQTPAGTRVPNFGFVIFEETRAVQRVLAHLEKRPIFLYDNHRLNVEEKKTKVSVTLEKVDAVMEYHLLTLRFRYVQITTQETAHPGELPWEETPWIHVVADAGTTMAAAVGAMGDSTIISGGAVRITTPWAGA